MMAGNPNSWWSIMVNSGNMHPPPPQSSSSSPSSSSSSYQLLPSSSPGNPNFYGASSSLADETPRSWSQLLMGGLGGIENEKFGTSPFHYKKVQEINWEDHQIGTTLNKPSSSIVDVIKGEGEDHHQFPRVGQLYGRHNNNPLPLLLEDDDHHHHSYFQTGDVDDHHQELFASSSPPPPPLRYCDTRTFKDNIIDDILAFSGDQRSPYKPPEVKTQHVHHRHSLEINSTSTSSGGAASNKKARVHHHSSCQPSLKVRKEKLGDRITALHQLVSPFGKTDTASVLSEAIGNITFLHTQIQALSSPYLNNAASGSMGHIPQQQSESTEDGGEGFRSRGLCLVPLSSTQDVSSSDIIINGPADYWPPALGGAAFSSI